MLSSMLDMTRLKDIGQSEILGPQLGEKRGTLEWQEARTLVMLNITLGFHTCKCTSLKTSFHKSCFYKRLILIYKG